MYREYEYFLHEVNAKMRLQVSFILSASLFGHMLRERKKAVNTKQILAFWKYTYWKKIAMEENRGREQGKKIAAITFHVLPQ